MLFFQNHQWKFRYDPRTKDQASSTKPHAPIFRKNSFGNRTGSLANGKRVRRPERAPGPSFKLQAASIKHQALQVPSGKLQAQNNKRQASSRK